MIDFYASEAWSRLIARMRASRMPHALLISGHKSGEKHAFARAIAESLLCLSPQETNARACGQCASCGLFKAGSHADFLPVDVSEDSREIKIGQIRTLCEELALTAQHGGYRVAIINPADAMNINASNSLLKTLEEPPPDTILILVTAKTGSISATVRSRCQRIRVESSSEEAIPQESMAALGEWLNAIWLREDALAIADNWAKREPDEVFVALFFWLQQRIREQQGARSLPLVSSRDIDGGNPTEEPATIEVAQLFGFYDKLLAAYHQAGKPGVSHRVLYEQLLLEARGRRLT